MRTASVEGRGSACEALGVAGGVAGASGPLLAAAAPLPLPPPPLLLLLEASPFTATAFS
jgi:hypothetical protein